MMYINIPELERWQFEADIPPRTVEGYNDSIDSIVV